MTPKHRRQRAEPRSAARPDDEKPKPAPAKVLQSGPDADPAPPNRKATTAAPRSEKETK